MERKTHIVAATNLAVELPTGTETGQTARRFFKSTCVPRFHDLRFQPQRFYDGDAISIVSPPTIA